MKILSFSIENFGRLHEYSCSLQDGVNVICEENGWGKSTLAAFIRAMFYGLEGDRKRSIEENERKRYKPWQGGVFGGRLTFETGGKRYEVTRIFYDKEGQDEFELRDADTNLPSEDYTANLGEELFRINRESFLRSVFIGQRECETCATDDICARIGNLADNTKDLNNYEAARARLTDMVNAMTPTRKTGSLSKRKDEITRLQRLVRDGENLPDSIDRYQTMLQNEAAQYDIYKEKVKENGVLQQRAAQYQSVLARKEEWQRLQKTAESRKASLDEAKGRFPGRIPEAQEIDRALDVCAEAGRTAERLKLCALSPEEQDRLQRYGSRFDGGPADAGEIDEMLRTERKYRELCREAAGQEMSEAERARLGELERAFAGDGESISAVSYRWNERNNRQAALSSKQAALRTLRASMDVERRRKSEITPPELMAVLLAAAVGCVVTCMVSVVFSLQYGLLALAIAAVAVFTTVLAVRSRRKRPVQSEFAGEYEALQREVEEDLSFIETADAKTAVCLARHGMTFAPQTAGAMLQELTEQYALCQQLRQKAEAAPGNDMLAGMRAMRERLLAFLERYHMGSSEERFADDLYALKTAGEDYAALQAKQEKAKEAETTLGGLREKIRLFLHQCGIEPAADMRLQLNALKADADAYAAAFRLYEEAASELAAFEQKTDPALLAAESPEVAQLSQEKLQQELLTLTEQMERSRDTAAAYEKTIRDLQEQYEQWEAYRLQLDELTLLQEKEQRQYDCLYKTRAYLDQAKEALTSRYVRPVYERFAAYYEQITGQSAQDVRIDANIEVTVEEAGRQRQTAALSTGYRDLIGICLRVAFADIMYRRERPMLIMDDPFTNLDDRKLAAAVSFLGQISGSYQILYFTCSRSRL